jgi:hypothetical protein
MCCRLTLLFSVLLSLMVPTVFAQVMCGDVITTDTVLEADVGPCYSNNDPALTIQGPAALDLNTFTVFCDPEDRRDGIYLIGRGAKLLNGTLKNCNSGVELMGTGHHRVTEIVSKDNNGDCFKIHEGSDRNMVTSNTSHGFACDNGFENSGNNNMLTNNLASDHDDSCYENHGNENIFRNNGGVNCGVGFSIDGMDNKVVINFATNTSFGFILGNSADGGNNNTVEKNKAVANGVGIQISIATDNIVKDNFSLGNDLYDMVDENLACDNNAWLNNVFSTAVVNEGLNDQTCIR